eukprot:7768836-Alexandrium_andersonii.AAC.1
MSYEHDGLVIVLPRGATPGGVCAALAQTALLPVAVKHMPADLGAYLLEVAPEHTWVKSGLHLSSRELAMCWH